MSGDEVLLKVGAELPPLTIPVTRTLIVAGAIASRDYQDVHHDAELARQKGSPDIFMNILTTNGLVGRYITDHFGPAAVLRRVAIRLGAPNYPGDTMVLTGTVTAVVNEEEARDEARDEARVEDRDKARDEARGEDRDGGGGGGGDGGVTVEVKVVGKNGLGSHVTGTVTVTVPRAGGGPS